MFQNRIKKILCFIRIVFFLIGKLTNRFNLKQFLLARLTSSNYFYGKLISFKYVSNLIQKF